METKFMELDLLLRTHDYTYMMSDDHRYWLAGEASKKVTEKLIAELSKLNPDRVGELILKYKSEYGTQFEVDI